MRKKPLIALFSILTPLLALYLWPVPRPAFEQVYAGAPAGKVASLKAFRERTPPSRLVVDGAAWEYVAVGQGAQTILLLHGMTGSYDIWWQQIEALKGEYRVIAVTYPALRTLAQMEAGILAILEREGVQELHLAGTSLGGYFAQYLVSRHPQRILSAVLANTFPPNDLILEKNGTLGSLVPFLPEWLVMNVLQGSFTSAIYPASGSDAMTLAFLNELAAGRVRGAQVAGRYRCVVEKFEPPSATAIPLLIIEAGNDPLVEAALREQLKATYPSARVTTVDNGHFPYISDPDFYTQTLRDFFGQ